MAHFTFNSKRRTVVLRETAEGPIQKTHFNATISKISGSEYGLYVNDKMLGVYPTSHTTVVNEEDQPKKEEVVVKEPVKEPVVEQAKSSAKYVNAKDKQA